MKLYLETTIINFLFATDSPEEMEITKNFFEKISLHECYISDTVLEEIEKATSPKKEILKGIINSYKFKILKIDDKIKNLAEEYIKSNLIPKKYFNDAMHIAIATIYKMDAIVSWNLEHIVKLKTEIGINKINENLGYSRIYICTPKEVL